MSNHLGAIWAAAAHLESLELACDQAEQSLTEALRMALSAGHPLPDVARAANLTPLELLALTDLPANTIHSAEAPRALSTSA